MLADITKETNMKQPKRYNFKTKPVKPNKFIMWWVKSILSDPILRRRNFKCEKTGMENIKPPYLLLATHASNMDFRILFGSIKPYNMNFVVTIEAMHDYTKTLMRLAGGIFKRRFTRNYELISHMRYCVNNHDNPLVMYPEAYFSPDGTTNSLSPAVGKICKLLKVPVAVLISCGSFIARPYWNKSKFNFHRVPLKGKLICVADAEEVRRLSAEELNERIAKVFVHDDLKYQYDNKIKINYRKRADGLHNILYKCCDCGTEGEMYSSGITLECRSCGKKWNMTEYGRLEALSGETKFAHIPDWCKWERECVKREIEEGTYCIEDDVEVHTLPNNKFYKQGFGKFRQDVTGTYLTCTAYGEPYSLHLAPTELESLHIEFSYHDLMRRKRFGDSMVISTDKDSFWLHSGTKRCVILKIMYATEEMNRRAKGELKNNSGKTETDG